MQHKELLTSTNHYITGEIQALVPTMRFNCSGKITSWKMAILQQNFELSVEPIKLQVWRYIGDGVYRLIGSNSIPYDQTEMPTIVTHNVSTNNQISFTAGDVIGFFITNSNYRLLLDSTNASSDIIYIPSVTGRQLCTFNTTCDQIIRMKKNFMPQLNIIYGKNIVVFCLCCVLDKLMYHIHTPSCVCMCVYSIGHAGMIIPNQS